jgi:hypothetical protein
VDVEFQVEPQSGVPERLSRYRISAVRSESFVTLERRRGTYDRRNFSIVWPA